MKNECSWLPDQRAREGRDGESRCGGVRLGVLGVVKADDVADEFENDMLESAAHRNERRSRSRA